MCEKKYEGENSEQKKPLPNMATIMGKAQSFMLFFFFQFIVIFWLAASRY